MELIYTMHGSLRHDSFAVNEVSVTKMQLIGVVIELRTLIPAMLLCKI